MKKGNRALAVLLSLVITLSYMPAMAFAGTEEGADQSGNGNVESGLEVENEDQTLTTGGDTVNDVEESNVQEEQAESNTPTANQQEPEEEPVLLGAEGDDSDVPEETGEVSAVAKIGETTYGSLKEAVDAANVAETATTITMLDDATVAETITLNPSKRVTLDLAGHKVTANLEKLIPLFKLEKGALTVKNSVADKGGISGSGIIFRIDSRDSGVTSVSGAAVTINKGVSVTSSDSPCVMIRGYANLTVNGSLTSSGQYATIQGNGSDSQGSRITITGNVKSNGSNAIYHPQAGTLTVNAGADIEGVSSGIAIKAGTLNINGGTIKATGDLNIPTEGWNDGVNASGCAIQIESNSGYNANGVSVSITGGSLESVNAAAVYEYIGKGDSTYLKSLKVTGGTFKAAEGIDAINLSSNAIERKVAAVSGGSFSSVLPAELCASGYKPSETPDENGMYGTEVAAESGVASITKNGKTTYYMTVNAAVSAAESGDEVVLVKDVTVNNNNGPAINLKTPKTIALNLNGHSLEQQSSKQSAIGLSGSAGEAPKLIIKGEGYVKGAFKAIKVGPYAEVSIDPSVNVTGGSYGVSIDGGQVVLTSEGNITGTEAGVFIDGAGTNKVVNINGGSVTGQYGVYSKQGATVIVSDGTVSGTTAAVALYGYQAYSQDSEYTIKLNVKGGTITGTGDAWAIAGSGSKDNGNYEISISDGTITADGCAIYHCNDGVLNVTGGSITGETAIYQKAGTMSISGGTITGNGEKKGYTYNGNGANATGDAIVIDNCGYPGGVPAPAITGGTISSTNANPIGSYAYPAEGDGAKEAVKGFVSGGTYSGAVAQDLCAEGYEPVKQEDGSYTVKKTDVAAIGEKTYSTLAEAVEAASDGDTIKMIADEKLRASVTVDKTLTLDLNGKKVFYDTESRLQKVLTIKGKGKTVTVTDTSEGKTGELNATASPTGRQDQCVEVVEGTFVVEGGTIAGPLFGIYNNSGATTKINGGTVTGRIVIRSHGSLEMTSGSIKATNTAMYLWPGSTTKISGGTIDSDTTGIELANTTSDVPATLDITDCDVVTRQTSTQSSTIISGGGNEITISGGSFNCKRSHSGRDTDMSFCTGDAVSISGGKFSLFAVDESQQPDFTITGGYFQNDISKYVKEPYRCVSDNTYERYLYRVGKFVASIQTESTETYYETFEEAVAAASAGDTIKLLADVELTATQNIDKNLVIDLNGNDIAAAGARALWVKSGNVEITGSGNISATGEKLGETSSVIRVGDGAANVNKAKLTVGKDVVVSTDKSYGITVFGNNDSDGDKTTSDIELVLNGKVNVTGKSSAVSGNGTSTLSATTMTIGSDAEVTATKDYAIYHPGKGTLTVNGKVEGLGGIEIKGGNIVINDGATIKATATEQSHTAYNDGASTSGYAIAAVNNPGYAGEPKVEINGGEITGVAIILADFDAENNGSITATTDKIDVPDGYKWVANEEGGYDLVVKEYVTVTFDLDGTKTEAKIEKGSKVDNWPADPTKENYEFIGWMNGESKYDKNSEFNESITLTATWVEAHATAINNGKLGYWRSLHRACEAADTGTTVTLLVDEEESKIINLSKTVAIDLNGHTWTYTGDRDNAIALTGQGNVTFKDSSNTNSGVLKTSTAKHLIYNNTKSLTIYGGTYEGKESAVYHVNDSSKTRLDGGIFIGAAGKSVGYGYDTKHNISIGKNAYFSDDAGNGNVFTRDDGWYLIKGADESKPDLYKLGQPAAIIGNQYYGSLNAAIKAANASDTVKLVNDVELSKTQEITKDVTIDLNGHNIAATDARALHIKSGNVEITGAGNISATGEGLADSSSVIRVGDGSANTNKAKLTVGKDVVVSTDKSYGITVFGKNAAPLELVLNGKVNVTGTSSAISGNGSAGLTPTSILIAEGAEVTSANEYGIYHPEDGTLTVNGKVEGKGGIEIKSGKLVVGDAATITATGKPEYTGPNGNGPSTSGYAIASVGNGGYTNVPAVEVQGGNVAGTVTSILENKAEKSGEIAATSDKISVPEGYAWEAEGDHFVLKTPLDFEKKAANEELDKVDIEQYSYDDLAKIRAALEKARADVDAAKTIDDVKAALDTFNKAKAECKTNTEKLAEAKSAANKQLDEYKPADYSGDDKTAVESAISKAKTAIEGAKTIEEVDSAVAEAKAAITACTTDAQKLENAKANANAQLDAVDKTGLSEADAAKVDKAITDAKAAIDEAKTIGAVNEALTAANSAIANIKSDASKLAGAKELAKAQLDAIDTTQYSDDELEAVQKAIADAKATIDEAATVTAVNNALSAANSTIAEQKTDAQKAAVALQSAKDAANAELNAIDTSNYSGDELKAVKDAIAAARTAIEAAKDVKSVTDAKSEALNTVSKQKTNTQKEAEKLAEAKETALTELGKIDTSKYSDEDLTAVTKAIDDAKAAIEDAETVEDVNAAVKSAEDAVAKQKTDEQKTADELQKTKDEALAKLDKIDITAYSGTDLKTVSDALKAAKEAINGAASADKVAEAMTAFETATKDCKTDDKKAEEALQKAKADALAELGKIDTSKYSDDELAAVTQAIEDAKAAIETAKTVDAVNAAVKTAEDAVAVQKTDEQKSAEALQNAKDEALAQLDNVDLAAYSGDDLKAMSAAIKAAKAAIKDATSADAVTNAMNTYADATKDCKTDEEKAEEATEENADKKLKEAEDAAKTAQTAAETAEASKTAAEAATKTPGQAAVDAAQKALDDANAAKKAADEALTKAKEAQELVDKAYPDNQEKKDAAKTLVDNATTAANNAATAVTNAQSAVTNAKNAKAAADKAKNTVKEVQDLPVVKITKPKAKKKKAVVRWKKVSKKNKKKIQGIQIQVATDAGFKNIVKSTTAKKTKKSKTIKGLKSKTRYWVRIRAYKNVGNVRHVSAWKVKKVKVK